MKHAELTPRTRLGHELEDALQEWIAASRRAYEPNRASGDVRAEEMAWGRVRSVLATQDVPAKAA